MIPRLPAVTCRMVQGEEDTLCLAANGWSLGFEAVAEQVIAIGSRLKFALVKEKVMYVVKLGRTEIQVYRANVTSLTRMAQRCSGP